MVDALAVVDIDPALIPFHSTCTSMPILARIEMGHQS